MHRYIYAFLIALLLCTGMLSAPVLADSTSQTETVTTSASANGGIRAVSPDKVKEKTDAIEGWALDVMSPIFHLVSKITLLIGLLMLVAVAFCPKIFGRTFIVFACVILGMAIFSNLSHITDGIQAFGQWLGQ